MTTRESVNRAVIALWRLPCKLMLATMVLCVGVREWYPFSPFPMFAGFGTTTWYVCVTDDADRPLPTEPYLGMTATPLRRMFETRVLVRMAAGASQPAAEAAAADDLLRFLRREARPQSPQLRLPSRLRLRRTVSRLEGERIVRTEDPVGELGNE